MAYMMETDMKLDVIAVTLALCMASGTAVAQQATSTSHRKSDSNGMPCSAVLNNCPTGALNQPSANIGTKTGVSSGSGLPSTHQLAPSRPLGDNSSGTLSSGPLGSSRLR